MTQPYNSPRRRLQGNYDWRRANQLCQTCENLPVLGRDRCQTCIDNLPEPETPLDTARYYKSLEGMGDGWRKIRRSFGWCDTCENVALPGLNHCGKCLDAVLEPEPLKAEVLSMQLPQEMGLRDWFAGMALAGLGARVHVDGRCEEAASDCYEMADAMMAARNAILPSELSDHPEKYPLGYEPRPQMLDYSEDLAT